MQIQWRQQHDYNDGVIGRPIGGWTSKSTEGLGGVGSRRALCCGDRVCVWDEGAAGGLIGNAADHLQPLITSYHG